MNAFNESYLFNFFNMPKHLCKKAANSTNFVSTGVRWKEKKGKKGFSNLNYEKTNASK